MGEVKSGLRVLTKRNPYFSEDPNIVVFTLDTASLSFAEVSGNAEALLGFPQERWLEADFWPERIHPDDRSDTLSLCASLVEELRDHELEYRVLDADGRTLWVHEIVEFDGSGAAQPSVKGFLMDITQRVAQEADVQGALALRDDLLRIATEELGQPINAISGFGKMLERHLAAQRDDVGSDYALGIRDGVEKLEALVWQLRSISQNPDMSFEEMSRSLAAIGAGDRARD